MKLLKLLFILLLMSWNSYPREPKGCLSMAQNRIVEGQKVVQCYKLPDEVGNLYKSWLRNDRKYGKNGQLLADQNWRYHYDDEGNLIEKENGQTAWQYHWYASGMLAKITKPNGIEVQYEYDALGRRTAKIVHDKITRYCWDGKILLHEFDYNLEERPTHVLDEDGFIVLSHPEPVNNLVTWIYDSGSFVPSAKIIEDKKYSILSDYLGRPAQAYNEEGEIVWEAQYDIYGKITKLKGDKTFVPFRQLGQYEDAEVENHYYNRYRWYDCETGLYLSQDPIGLHGNNPTFYGYVLDSNSEVDVFGLSCTKKLRKSINKAQRDLRKKGLMRRAWRKEKGSAAHHIVAGDDVRAQPARDILIRHGIDIDGADNGIYLKHIDPNSSQPGAYHRVIHTDRYYENINQRITDADALGGKQGVLDELNSISDDLLFNNKIW